MRKYETIFITDPDLREEQVREVAARVARAIDRTSGKLLQQEDWGVKKLAYRVRRQMKGRYLRVVFAGDGGTVAEAERQLKISEPVMKYISAQIALAATDEEIAGALPVPEVGLAALPGEGGPGGAAAEAEPAEPGATEQTATAREGAGPEAGSGAAASGGTEEEEGEEEEDEEGEGPESAKPGDSGEGDDAGERSEEEEEEEGDDES